jgi:hypothetical protein
VPFNRNTGQGNTAEAKMIQEEDHQNEIKKNDYVK